MPTRFAPPAICFTALWSAPALLPIAGPCLLQPPFGAMVSETIRWHSLLEARYAIYVGVPTCALVLSCAGPLSDFHSGQNFLRGTFFWEAGQFQKLTSLPTRSFPLADFPYGPTFLRVTIFEKPQCSSNESRSQSAISNFLIFIRDQMFFGAHCLRNCTNP